MNNNITSQILNNINSQIDDNNDNDTTGGNQNSSNVSSMQIAKFPNWIVQDSKKINNCVDYGLLDITDKSVYSSLLPYQLKQVRNILSHINLTEGCIVDATAHIGCDSFNFALYFSRPVIAIENNNFTYNCMCNNINKLKINVQPINADYVNYMDTLKNTTISMVYFDPPWGGREYKNHEKVKLKLSDRDIEDIIYDTLSTLTTLVLLKVPKNFDMTKLNILVNKEKYILNIGHITKRYGEIIYSLITIRKSN